jgi:hypothetical protein
MRKRKHSFLFNTSRILIIVIITIIFGFFLTQSSLFLNFVRRTLISQVNKQINGSIEITGLHGNLFKHLTLLNVVLLEENSELKRSEIIHLKQLDLDYDLRYLIQKKIVVTSIAVSELTVNLHQDDQGIWNVTNIPVKKETTPKDTTSGSWQIVLESLIVSDSKVNISGANLSEQLPREISISRLISKASLGEKIEWELSKAELAVQPQEINISLTDLQGNDKLDINLKQLDISSSNSQIQLTGNMINQPVRKANLSFRANPLDLSELQTWLPTFPLLGNPYISGEVEVQGDSLSTIITVNFDEQVITLQAQLPSLQNPLTSYLDLTWKDLNTNSWNSGLPESSLNGSIVASTQGKSWPEVDAKITLKLTESDFNAYKIYSLELESKGSPAHLISTLQLESEFGEINVEADLENLLNEIAYAISGSMSDIEVLKIAPTFPYQTDINSQFSLNGIGSDPKKLDATFQLNFAESSFDNKLIDTLKLSGKYQQGNYQLDEIEISYDGLDFSANGQGNIYGNNELSYNLQIDSLPQIVQELLPDLALKGSISGTADGTVEDLKANTRMDLQDVRFQSYQLASLNGKSEFRLIDKIPEADFTGVLTRIELPTLPLDSIRVNAHYTPEKVFLDVNLTQSDTLALRLMGDIFPTLKQAYFSKLEIYAFGQTWQNTPDTLIINFDPQKLSLRNFALSSDTQIIVVDFLLDSQESYAIEVKCDSLALWPLRFLNPKLETIQGKISLNIVGKGDLNNPQLSATWNLDNLSLRDIALYKIAGNIDYQESVAQLLLEVNRTQQDTISLMGYLPFQADITKKKFSLLHDEPLELELKTTPLDLSILNDYTNAVKEVKGKLNLRVKIDNTLSHPLVNAQLLIENAAVKHPALGIDYRDINLDFEAHENILELKNFSVPTGKNGYLKANGSTVLNLKNAHLDSLRFSLKAKNFQALKSSNMDLKFDSKLNIAGNSTSPTFSGYLNVLRARLYLPALLGRESKKVVLTTPLLLAGTSDGKLTEADDPELNKEPSQIMKNLRGKLKLSFPNNTWLKSKEINLELGGEMEIIKNSPDFVLSGNVKVVRGNYTIYGRRFNISSGSIMFQGESDLNPEINVVADYILRSSSQEKHTLSIKITGNLKQPAIQFLLDGVQISEGDGMSYIIFGKSTAELSSGERSQMGGSGADDLAAQIVVRQIASRVTNVLQNRLNLDVIEFKGDTNWRQAQVVVGKYLTNNLFLSYERELSFGKSNEVVPEKITLEYEITRKIYLQGTQGGDKATGVDLIWKFQR